MTSINEIAPDVYRISTYVPEFDLQFNQFLVKDDEPLLYHTGMRAMFPQLLETVGKILDPSTIRWIGFSHFEADECGALNNWLEAAPSAEAVCTFVGAMVSVNDFATRPAHILNGDDVLRQASIATVSSTRPICRTAGMRACCSRRPSGLCSVPTSFIRAGMSSHQQNPT